MSAFGGKADITRTRLECPLLTQSGHSVLRIVATQNDDRNPFRRSYGHSGVHFFAKLPRAPCGDAEQYGRTLQREGRYADAEPLYKRAPASTPSRRGVPSVPRCVLSWSERIR